MLNDDETISSYNIQPFDNLKIIDLNELNELK